MEQHRTLEINLQCARDLNKVNLITKMDIYAVVSISGGDKKSNQKTKTPVDHVGDADPAWNFPMKFTVDEAALQQNRLTLDIKLVCERALGDKDVGEVNVAIKELLDSPAKGGADGKKFVSYQVRKPSGRPKGQLSFSYQFTDIVSPPAATAPPFPMAGKVSGEPVVAYPAGTSSAYPMGVYPPPPVHGGGHYPPPPAHSTGMYPQVGSAPPEPHHGYVYPPQQGYGYPPPPPAHGYAYPPPPPPHGYPPQGYGYPPVQPQQPKKNKFGGLGLGAGLLGGAIGGLLIGDMISDGGGFDCGGFDF